jgi:3-hydroxyisobutyrate dehydrogenase-like beta-hydroxyacid dehydrogenase
MTQNRSVVGFIGLGAIGAPMADRLVQAGEDVVVYNRTIGKTARFRGRAKIAGSPAGMADAADIIFVCVTSPDAYRDTVLGPLGLIHGRSAKTYVHVGTNEAAFVEQLAAALRPRGIVTLDAPVTGGIERAANGTLTVMASGPHEAFTRAEPFFKHYAKNITFLGERIGAAQIMKLVNNVISAGNLAIACEALVVGRKAGLDPAIMLDVINNGSGQSNATSTKVPAHILTRKFSYGATIGPAITILETLAMEARGRDVPVPLLQSIIATLRTAAAEEGGAADVTRIICPMERAAGATVGVIDANNTPSQADAVEQSELPPLPRAAQRG